MNPQILFLLEAVPGRVFGLDQQMAIQIGIQLFNACLLAFILSWLLYNPVRNFLINRSIRIREQLRQAEEDMTTANDLRSQYEGKLKEVDAERDEILSAARKLAAEKGKEILAEAKVEADAVKARADINIKIEQERVKEEMRQTIIEISSAIAQKYITQAIDKNTHDRLFTEVMAEMEEMTWQN